MSPRLLRTSKPVHDWLRRRTLVDTPALDGLVWAELITDLGWKLVLGLVQRRLRAKRERGCNGIHAISLVEPTSTPLRRRPLRADDAFIKIGSSMPTRASLATGRYGPPRWQSRQTWQLPWLNMAVIKSPIVGTVWKIQVAVGDAVAEDDDLMILESMKMEIPVEAESGGTVTAINVAEGNQVKEGDPLATID